MSYKEKDKKNMPKEQFNPSNPEYKKVADLPDEEQKHFSDVEGGFVRKETLLYEKYFKEIAEKYNKTGRTFFQKILNKNNMSYIDVAEDFAKTDTVRQIMYVGTATEYGNAADDPYLRDIWQDRGRKAYEAQKLETKVTKESLPEELRSKLKAIKLNGIKAGSFDGDDHGFNQQLNDISFNEAIDIAHDHYSWLFADCYGTSVELKYEDNDTSVEIEGYSMGDYPNPTIKIVHKGKEYVWIESKFEYDNNAKQTLDHLTQ